MIAVKKDGDDDDGDDNSMCGWHGKCRDVYRILVGEGWRKETAWKNWV